MALDYGTRAVPRLDLGEALWEFMLNNEDFIAREVAPVFETEKEASTYSRITRESIARRAETIKRALGAAYARDDMAAEDDVYACEEYGIEFPVGDREQSKFKTSFNAEMSKGKLALRRVLMEWEIRINTLLFNISTWTGADLFTDYSGAPWDAVGSDAIGQVRTAVEQVRANSGVIANALIMNPINIIRLKANTAVLEAIKYTARTTDQELERALADLFGVQRIIVGKAVYDSAIEGQDFTGAYVWSDDYVMVARIGSDGQDLNEPTVARNFLWTEDSPEPTVVEEYREEQTRGKVIRVRHNVDEKVMDPFFAHLLQVDVL